MESGITPGPILSQGTEVLAQTSYTLREEDFVAWWMYCWEDAQNQRLHPFAHRLADWTSLMIKTSLAITLFSVFAAGLAGEKSTKYVIGASLFIFCWALGLGLLNWFLRGPKGLFRKLARIRYYRKMRRLAPRLAAQKSVFNLGRFHRLFLTRDSLIHLAELHEIEQGTTINERIEIITPWSVLDRIEVCEHHIFFIDRRPFTTILPRRAFADEEAFQQLMEVARGLHQDAMQSSASLASWKKQEERIKR